MFELRKLLMSADPSATLKVMHENGELASVLPELDELDIKDRYSHRHKNNFYHSLIVLDQAIELESEPDIILRTAALLHDIGKKATRRMTSSGHATFVNHENIGARMARKILKNHTYSKPEIDAIYELIANHMRSYGFKTELWTDSAVRRFASDISTEEQLERLFKIFKADMSTKHNSKRAAIYSKVDALAKRVVDVKRSDTLAARRPAVNGNELMRLFGLEPGRKLGNLMKFLNSEEGLALSRDEAIEAVRKLI